MATDRDSTGIENLDELISSMDPTLQDGEYAFVTVFDGSYGKGAELQPIATFQEEEGLTLVIPVHRAEAARLAFDGTFRRIRLGVHSSLSAVGLTAAVATVLTERGISANVIAAFHHDHIFVPTARAEEALEALRSLSAR